MNTEQIEAMQIRMIPVAEVTPYSRNARTHSPAQIDLICASMKEYGWTNPILIADGTILAGHGRLQAAQKLGLTRVPCLDLSHLTEVQRRAYVLSDNQIANFGTGWDMELLKLELADLKLEGFDMDLLGFGDQLTDLMDPDLLGDDKDPDDVPDVPEVAHSKSGDMWICGPHKIICSDSTAPETWSTLLGSELADVVLTDPPFGVSYKAKGKKAIANDDLTGDKLRAFLLLVNKCLFDHLKPGASAYIFHADSEGLAFRQSVQDAGFKVSQCLTWVKDSLVLGRSRYHWRHEPVLLCDKPGGKQRWWGGRKQTTVLESGEGSPFTLQDDGRWAIKVGDETLIVSGEATFEQAPGSILRHPKPKRSEHHPTQKPVLLLERILKNSARQNDLVLEPFSGSGSTLMAAERLGMCCRASELDPGYVDVAVMRWQAWTGRAAVHAVTGEAFPVSPAECQRF